MQNLAQCVCFPIFRKGKAFLLNYMSDLPFSIALWTICSRSIFSLVFLKVFWNFQNISRKQSMGRQLFSGVLQDRCPENLRKLRKKTPLLESLCSKASRSKETLEQVFSYEFYEAFKNSSFTEHLRWSWSLSLKNFTL